MTKFLSGIKKLAVMIIASAMLLGVVPIGLISRPETVNAEGEFVRLSPAEEAFVSAVTGETALCGKEISDGVLFVGSQNDAYMRFDLSSLSEIKTDDIRSVSLRLAVISTGMESTDKFKIKFIPENRWNSSMNYLSKPANSYEKELADISMDDYRKTGSVIETDLTEFIKTELKAENTNISLLLNSEAGGLAAVFAASGYEDKAFRPCLKIVTGDAEDTDRTDLTKAWLEHVDAQYDGENIVIDSNHSAYLKFKLDRDNIQGAMYDIRMKANSVSAESEGNINVSLIDCGDSACSSENTERYSEHSVGSVSASAGQWGVAMTDAINDIFIRDENTVTLKLSVSEGRVLISGGADDAPYLDIRATDNPKIVAVIEAGSSVTQNFDIQNITSDLPKTYTASDGTRAFFKWSAYDSETNLRCENVLFPDGDINRPAWYEKSRTIRAKAVISSGAYRAERNYILSISPQDKPVFTDSQISDYTDIGSAESEKSTFADAISAESHSRRVDGNYLTYRSLGKDSVLVVNQRIDGNKQNYLTIKLSEDKLPTSKLVISNADDHSADPVVYELAQNKIENEGFLYITLPLPREYTDNKSLISLKLTTAVGSISDNEAAPWDIYAIYTGSEAHFDPSVYTNQTEEFINKNPVSDNIIARFAANLYHSMQQVSPIPTPSDNKDSHAIYKWSDTETSSILAFSDSDISVIASLDNDNSSANIRFCSAYYNAVCEIPFYKNNKSADIDYGSYRIIRNLSKEDIAFPQDLSGIYKNLVDGKYYSFIKPGEIADDSALAEGTAIIDGRSSTLAGGETAILKFAAKPLEQIEWRVGKINGIPVSNLSVAKDTVIKNITVKNLNVATGTDIKVICCVYERGMLCGITSQVFTTESGTSEYSVDLSPVMFKPGRTLKIFVEPADSSLSATTPKLELP